MEFNNFAYLLTLAGTVAIPLILGFNKQLRFYRYLKYLIPAILFSGAIFIMVDSRFAEYSAWHFNPEYILGKRLLNLPVEEWLYFAVVSFFGVSVYEFLNWRIKNFERPNLFLSISLVLLVLAGLIAYFSKQKAYPFVVFFLLTIYLGYIVFRSQFKKHYTKFYLSYFVLLLPFVLVKSVLIGLPVIEYNSKFILGAYIFSIPVEDFASLFLLHLITITVYEYLKEHRIY